MEYELVIGLEVHIKLNSINKLFCQCKNEQEFGELKPNTHICPFCSGQPGGLPVINKEPIEKAALLGHALGCNVNTFSVFDRKSYFYPDLPPGYQITQDKLALNTEGTVHFWVNDFETKKTVHIQKAHVECDAGKMIHEGGKAYIDYNRACTPLVEIVTYPDFRSSDEVVEFLKELQRIARANNIGDADLEKGQMRADVNMSIRPKGSTEYGTKVEMKNMNSFSAIKRAIEHEYNRQVSYTEKGISLDQETRGRNDDRSESYSMRSKENALDYRYFPDPDLPPLVLEQSWIDTIKSHVVESTASKIGRYKEAYQFNKEYINSLIGEVNPWFEKAISQGYDAAIVARWLVTTVSRHLNENNWTLYDLPYGYDHFEEALSLLTQGKIIDSQLKVIFQEMVSTGKKPQQIADEKGFKAVDEGELLQWVDEVIEANPKAVTDVKNGDMKSIGFLIGQLAKKSGGKADPRKAKELLEKKIMNG